MPEPEILNMNRPVSFPAFPVVRLVLPAADDWSELSWYGFTAERGWSAQGRCVLAQLPMAGELEILLPARCVSAHALTLPAQAGKHVDALIAQALEDRLLGDRGDALALVEPPQTAGSERRVWVCSRRWLEAGLERLVAAGFNPTRLLPEYALLPEPEDGSDAVPYALVDGGAIFRTACGQFGMVADENDIPALAGKAALQRVNDLAGRPAPDASRIALPKALARFSRQRFDWQSWVPSLRLVASCAALLLLGSLIHWRQLESREARLQHEIRQTFASAFPGTPIVDPVLQWESKQREVSQGGGDALDAVIGLAARLNAPIRPRRIEAGDGFVRLTLSDSEVAQFKAPLESVGKPETSPAEAGLTRLHYRLNAPGSRP